MNCFYYQIPTFIYCCYILVSFLVVELLSTDSLLTVAY